MNILEQLERNRAVYLLMTAAHTGAEAHSPGTQTAPLGPRHFERAAAARETATTAPLPSPPAPLERGQAITWSLPAPTRTADFPRPPAAYSIQRPRVLSGATDITPPVGAEPAPRAQTLEDPLTALEERIETRSRLQSQLLGEEDF